VPAASPSGSGLRHASATPGAGVTIVGLHSPPCCRGRLTERRSRAGIGCRCTVPLRLHRRAGLVTFSALFVVVVSLLIDVVSAWVDPEDPVLMSERRRRSRG